MALHNDVGKEAEELAVSYLIKNGYDILYRNWRHSYYEIDIIAIKDELLRIVEVKALKHAGAGYPEQSVTKKKFKRVLKAADEFLFQHQEYRHVQFDVLAIILEPRDDPEYFLIEDVFF